MHQDMWDTCCAQEVKGDRWCLLAGCLGLSGGPGYHLQPYASFHLRDTNLIHTAHLPAPLLRCSAVPCRAALCHAVLCCQAAMRRYYVCGLREVRKAIKGDKARLVLLAPNIEQVEAEGGLNDSVQDILDACNAADVPVVFALSRKKMGEVYGFRKRMSAIALLEVSGVQDVMAQVLHMAADGRRRWQASAVAATAGAAFGGPAGLGTAADPFGSVGLGVEAAAASAAPAVSQADAPVSAAGTVGESGSS